MFYEINDNKKLVEILNCFLWEIVSDYVDHDAESLKEVLRSKCYLDIDCNCISYHIVQSILDKGSFLF